MLSWWRFQWMINDQNGSCLMLGWSPSFASCGAWNSMLWYASCLPSVLIGSVPRKKTRDDMPQREVLVRFGGVLLFFSFWQGIECRSFGPASWTRLTGSPLCWAPPILTMPAAWNPFQNRTKGAYANNQHDLKVEIQKNPRKTSFYRAIKLCAGVLLILDSDATPFTRSLGCNAILSERKSLQVSIASSANALICIKVSTR